MEWGDSTLTWQQATRPWNFHDDDEVRYRGFVINSDDPDHPYDLVKAEGLRGASVRTGDTPIPRGDGDTPGDHHLDAKRPVLTVNAVGDYHGVVPPLLEAFRPSRSREFPLIWVDGQFEVRLYCRPVDTPVVREARSQRITEIAIGLKASDPRIYGGERSVTLEHFTTLGGAVNDPVDEPKNATEEGGTSQTAHNAGTSDAHPRIVISGPDSGTADAIELTNVTNGSKVTLSASIGASQTLTFRMREWVTRQLDALIVELDGANRYDDWDNRGEVFYLSPGDNEIRFDVTAGTSDGVRATLRWRDTWDGIRRDD